MIWETTYLEYIQNIFTDLQWNIYLLLKAGSHVLCWTLSLCWCCWILLTCSCFSLLDSCSGPARSQTSIIKISHYSYSKYTTTQLNENKNCHLNVRTVWELLTHWKEERFQPWKHVNQPCADAQEYEPTSGQLQSICNTFNTHQTAVRPSVVRS